MKAIIKPTIVLLLTTLSLSFLLTGCSSSTTQPLVKQDNPADSQRSNAKKAQDELSRETVKEK
jgi:outer membrane biogenesis lipoprotein LolB